MDYSSLSKSVDEVFETNIFLKEAEKVDSLKGELISLFSGLDSNSQVLSDRLDVADNYTRNNIEDIYKFKQALIQYLKDNITISQTCLNNLDEWY